MAQHQKGGQYGDQLRRTDEYGNPVSQVDQYDNNPVHQTGTDGGLTGTTGHGHDQTTGTHATHTGGATGYGGAPGEQHHEKKGVVDQIKEKIPGTKTTSTTGGDTGHGTTTGGGTGTGQHYGGAPGDQPHEKKGVVDKIKEKIPGTNTPTSGEAGYGTTTGTGTGMGHGTTTGGTGHHEQSHGEYGGEQQHEKKGMVGKIKEKLPGGH